jgi:(p)ppGpp synthase/HD superfamily hydrolase
MEDKSGDKVRRAREYASREHVEIRRQQYGSLPYTAHLDAVVNVLERYGVSDENILAAGYLHDILEDCPEVTGQMLAQEFGAEVVALVLCVTDGEGKNRKERKVQSYFRMQSRPEVIPLKLADRIANVESCLIDEASVSLLEMYRSEHAEFRSKLYEASLRAEVSFMRMRVRGMWAYLDELLATHTPDTQAND